MKKVLVIGRHPQMMSAVLQKLTSNNYLAIGAIENQEALDLFKIELPDAVVIGGGVDGESRALFYTEFSQLNPQIKMIDGHPQTILADLESAVKT